MLKHIVIALLPALDALKVYLRWKNVEDTRKQLGSRPQDTPRYPAIPCRIGLHRYYIY